MANKTIKNLTKHDISIVDYKKNLNIISPSRNCLIVFLNWGVFVVVVGNAAIEKAKLFRKTATKGKT